MSEENEAPEAPEVPRWRYATGDKPIVGPISVGHVIGIGPREAAEILRQLREARKKKGTDGKP